VSPAFSSSRKVSQSAHSGTSRELAMRTRGTHGCVRKTATGLPDWTSQRLVVVQALQSAHDGPEALPVAGGLAGAAVDDEVFGALGDLGVEVVHEHA
jgi:hypothetical protein